jgi:sterol 3beta-glucosyltransferase
MKLTFLCFGSRGDVQPYIALGIGFQQAGHQVCIATHEIFKEMVQNHGLMFAPVKGNPREILEGDSARQALNTSRNIFKMAINYRKFIQDLMDEMLDSSIQACQGADALLYGLMGIPAYHLADYWKIPRFPMLLQPVTRTGAFPSPGFPELPLGQLYNRLSWRMGEQVFGFMLSSISNKWRYQRLKLGRMQPDEIYTRQVPYTYGFSEHILPRPPDFPAWHRIAGYWYLNQTSNWSPTAELLDFLNSGPPPVYIGFGSMNAGEAERSTRIVLEAVKENNLRAILLRGWGGLHSDDLPGSVFMLDSIPHDWLFPQMSTIIHHGGAGTTGAAFRSGKPQVVVPYFADQPFWAGIVQKNGAGIKTAPMSNLKTSELSGAIQRATKDRQIYARAAEIGEKIRAEDGVSRAVEWIDGMLHTL